MNFQKLKKLNITRSDVGNYAELCNYCCRLLFLFITSAVSFATCCVGRIIGMGSCEAPFIDSVVHAAHVSPSLGKFQGPDVIFPHNASCVISHLLQNNNETLHGALLPPAMKSHQSCSRCNVVWDSLLKPNHYLNKT